MAFNFLLPKSLRKARWKMKIRDKENREHPHVTIIRGTVFWRVNLRTWEFMDDDPDPALIPKELIKMLSQKETRQQLCREWDQMYLNNPVSDESEE